MSTAASAPAVIIPHSSWTLTDRIRIQQDLIREKKYRKIGKLTCVVWEGQRSSSGMSQSHGRTGITAVDTMMSEWQRTTWCSLTLDYLSHFNAPILAISNDRNDLLLPFRLPALPDIPDPRWKGNKVAPSATSRENKVPRIPQLLAGCPVVGDRSCGRIVDRISGKTFLIFRPLTELQVMCGGGKESGFGRIRCATDPADHTHSALLVNQDPDSDGSMEAYFVGGSFHAG